MPTLRELREAAGMTQKELAERIGVASNTVTRWEMAADGDPSNAIRPRGPARRLLGHIFNIDPDEIEFSPRSKERP